MNEEKDFKITKKEFVLEGIPFTTYELNDNKPKPLLFFFHGFGGNRTIGIMGRGEILASKGFYVVAMDSHLHGERQPEFLKKLSSSDRQKDIINMIMQTAKDAKHLYEKYLIHWQELKVEKVYAYGVSMGAAVAFYLGTIMKELKTFACIVGSPSFCDFYLYKKSMYNWEADDYFMINLNSYKEEDPLINCERLKDKNIYMGNGTLDTIVPMRFAKELSEKLKSPNIVFKLFNIDHSSTPEMQEEAYQFLLEH